MLSRQCALHPIVAHIALNRGLTAATVERFLRPTLAACHDPAGLADLERASERLVRAVEERRPVVVYGDYDADGCCAGALMTRFLAGLQVPVSYYVPDRFDEGYGINAAALLGLITQRKPALIVTVDCGIASAEEIDTAAALGTDVIVTDHHQVPERLPAVPAIDPHRPDCTYPDKDLCGTAVAYKLCQHAAERLGLDAAEVEASLIELVAIGTVADVMPLTGENRYFVTAGLEALARTRTPGLRALMETARLGHDGVLTARDLAFGVGPRLNAAGRLDDATTAYRLLVTDDTAEAYQLAETLERLNRERREIEERTTEEAAALMAEVSLHDVWGVTLAAEGWHEGVLGLVAGRLCRRHWRPVLALTLNDEVAKGSGRSTPAVDLHAALATCADLFSSFGGHPRAAGLTLPKANLEPLRARFNEAVRAQVTDEALLPVIDLECAVKAGHVDLELARQLARLAPFGEGNPEPVLEIRGLRLDEAKATRDGTHLQLRFQTVGSNRGPLKGFWPRMGRYAERIAGGGETTVAASVAIDAWQGREQPQLMIQDMRLGPGD